MSFAIAETKTSPEYRAAKERLGHRVRPAAILDIEGPDRVAFLQGLLTQEVRGMRPGEVRPAAGLTPKGKLLFIARLYALPEALRLLLPAPSRTQVLEHLKKYAAFQKVAVADRSDEVLRIGLYGADVAGLAHPPPEAQFLVGEGEFAAEIVAPVSAADAITDWLRRRASVAVSEEAAEALRVEAGRPRFGQDADESHLADELGLEAAISTTKGCYVGQEVVARLRTYGRVNRRLVGFRFEGPPIPAGALLKRPEEPEPGRIEQGRVTSSVLSPSFGAIGLGFAFREVPVGERLVWAEDSAGSALVTGLPFS